jgi:hypothetical protein
VRRVRDAVRVQDCLQVCAKEAKASKCGALCLQALRRCLNTFASDAVAVSATTNEHNKARDFGAILRLVMQVRARVVLCCL